MAQAYGSEHEVRVVFGPQYGRFTQAGIDVFLGSPYKVAIQSDRMGYRLEGPVIEHGDGPDVISDGTSFGAVQVPGDGQPIVLLADRGTTGGYTKIATVINSDLYKFAQAMPGQTMSFKSVSIEEAHEIYRIRESLLDEIRAEPPIETEDKAVRLEISVGGRAIELVDEGGDDIPIPSWARDAGAAGQFKGSASIKGETFEFDVTIQEID